MYVLIRTSNSDRRSGHLASREEAADAWRWLVADSRAHSDTFAVHDSTVAWSVRQSPQIPRPPRRLLTANPRESEFTGTAGAVGPSPTSSAPPQTSGGYPGE